MKTTRMLVALAATLASAGALADETTVQLKQAPETTTVVANCSICHSLDYIPMNSRFLDRAHWEAEVKKMVGVMGAPISADDQATIVNYLVREYGVGN